MVMIVAAVNRILGAPLRFCMKKGKEINGLERIRNEN